MPSFALVTEGLTDQVTISAILTGHYGEEPDIVEAQPLRDATDESRQGSFAGWEEVFNYCASELFEQLFYVNDFVIIQIDTDVCGHKNFDVPMRIDKKNKSTGEIIEDVANHIVSKISPPIYQQYREQIIFAISIHSLECWLLPLFGRTKVEKEKIRKCENHLSEVLKRFNITYEKTHRVYESITKPFLDREKLEQACKHNESLKYFISSLPAS